MRFKHKVLITALAISTNLHAIENLPLCEPAVNSISVGCLFEQNPEIPENQILNVLSSRDQYVELGMSEQDAIFHAINLEMIKTQHIHRKNIEQLEQLWHDIRDNKVRLD